MTPADHPCGPRTVLLRHDQPDGSWHVDWLIDVPGDNQDRVPTFRMPKSPLSGERDLLAERLDDHRRHYLDYEGDIGGGRGRVSRLASGVVLSAEGWPGATVLIVDLGDGPVQWRAVPGAGREWRFTQC
jgi:hypothetical protein